MISLIINGINLKEKFNWSATSLNGLSAPSLEHTYVEFAGLHGSRNLDRSRFTQREFSFEGILYKSENETVEQMKDRLIKILSVGLYEEIEIKIPHNEILNGVKVVKERTIYARLNESPIITQIYKPVHNPSVLKITLNFVANDPFFYFKEEYENEIYLSSDLYLKSPLKPYYPRDPDYVYVGLTLANLLGNDGKGLSTNFNATGLIDGHVYFETCNYEKFTTVNGEYTIINNTGGVYDLAIYDLTEMGELQELFKESFGKNFWSDLSNKTLKEFLPYVDGVQGLNTDNYGVIEL
jgi:hypothetical protein